MKYIYSAPYGGLQRLTRIASSGGSGAPGELSSETLVWNSNLTLSTFTNGRGVVTRFPDYDSLGNPRTIQEGYNASTGTAARTTTLTWHPVLSRPLTVSRASVQSGQTHLTTFNYNVGSTQTNYLQQVIDVGYTDSSLTGGVGSQATYTTTLGYDGANGVTRVTGPLRGGSTTLAYYLPTDSYPNYLKTTTVATSAASNLVTTFTGYDGEGRVTSVLDPNGVSTAYTYDPLGLVTQATVQVFRGPSNTNSYVYDLAENLLSRTYPEGTTAVNEYDAALRMWRQHATASDGSTPWSTVYDYDTWNQPLTIRHFAGLGSDLGSGCTTAGPEQLCKELAYDAWRRVSYERTLDSSNNACSGSNCEVLYTYDGNGNVATRSEAGLNVYSWSRDLLDRVTAIGLPILNADGGVATSTVAYDINDRLISRRDPKDGSNGGGGGSRLTTYLNDDFGRPISIVNPDIGTWISNYDSAGNLASSRDATGAKLYYTYDYASRQLSIDGGVTNEFVSFQYDQTGSAGQIAYANTAGRLSSVNALDSAGHVVNSHFTYDYLGRTLADIEERGPVGATTFAALQYTWRGNGEPSTMTYPDGLVTTFNYPTAGGYGPTPLPSEVDAPFNGTATALVSGATYFPDGVVQGLTYANGSTRSLTRNKRGELTSLASGPTAAPWLNQAFTYDANGLGNLTSVTFNPSKANTWTWNFGYDGLRRLTSYNTNVRPTTDQYTWTYDEIGNRKTEVYNTVATNYVYDTANQTSQVMSLNGGNTRNWTYDANGSTVQDHWYGGAGTWNQYGYTTRHHVSSLNYYDNSVFQFTSETYQDDGLERRWQKTSHTGAWTQFYYDLNGRVAQEYQNNGVTVNGCAAYDVVDHVYLGEGANEVSRVIRRFQSGTGCTSYGFVDMDLYYVHEDYRNTVFAIESKAVGGLGGEQEISPFGVLLTFKLPGPDGKIGTSDDVTSPIAAALNSSGLFDAIEDSEFSNLAYSSDENNPAVSRPVIAGPEVWGKAGFSPYHVVLAVNQSTLSRMNEGLPNNQNALQGLLHPSGPPGVRNRGKLTVRTNAAPGILGDVAAGNALNGPSRVINPNSPLSWVGTGQTESIEQMLFGPKLPMSSLMLAGNVWDDIVNAVKDLFKSPGTKDPSDQTPAPLGGIPLLGRLSDGGVTGSTIMLQPGHMPQWGGKPHLCPSDGNDISGGSAGSLWAAWYNMMLHTGDPSGTEETGGGPLSFHDFYGSDWADEGAATGPGVPVGAHGGDPWSFQAIR